MNDRSPAGASAGALLRTARERQGLHIAALAAAIKVTPRKLDALENDRHDELPDATFTRALAQSVCRTLKIDAAPVLERLPPSPVLSLGRRGSGLNTPFRDRPGRSEPEFSLAAVRPLVWAAALLVIGALLVYFWPAVLNLDEPNASSVAADGAGPAAAASLLSASGTPTGAADATSFAPSPPVAAIAPVATSASEPIVETVFSAPPFALGASGAASAPAGLVQLHSTEPSWIEVRDARNQLLLSRTVQPGESVSLDGTLPMRLVIGNAASTQLGFRGQAVDLGPRTHENIARVELP